MLRIVSKCLKRWKPHQVALRTMRQRTKVPFAPMYQFCKIQRRRCSNNINSNNGTNNNNNNTNNNNNKNTNDALITTDSMPANSIATTDTNNDNNNNDNNNNENESKDDFDYNNNHELSEKSSNLMLKARDCRKFMVGIDGTKYGYLALEHAFSLTNPNDKIIGLHIPLDVDDDGLEMQDPLVYRSVFNTVKLNATTKEQVEKEKEIIHQKFERKSFKIKNSLNKNNTDFEFIVFKGPKDDIQKDIVYAVNKFKVDYLVLGHKGVAHSINEALDDLASHMLGNVAAYCVRKANCTVIIAKPEDTGLYV